MANISYTLFMAFKAAGKTGLLDQEVADLIPNVGPRRHLGYVSHLERAFGCKFDRVKSGRTILKYVLLNASEVTVPDNGRPAKKVATKKPIVVKKTKTTAATKVVTKKVRVTNTKPVADSGSVSAYDAELDISEVGDRELADIRSQLGL